MNKPSLLVKIFREAGAVAARLWCINAIGSTYLPSQKLNENEISLVESIFGAGAEASRIKKNFRNATWYNLRGGADDGNKGMVAAYVLPYHTFSVNFVSPWFYQQDYAKLQITQLEYQAPMLLMHEVTHLMQNKKMFSYVEGISRYTYVLSPHKTFEGYGQEQQAIMIEDYISRFLCPSPLPSFETWHMKNDVDCTERDALLAETVENQFPQAKISREGVAAGKLKLVI